MIARIGREIRRAWRRLFGRPEKPQEPSQQDGRLIDTPTEADYEAAGVEYGADGGYGGEPVEVERAYCLICRREIPTESGQVCAACAKGGA